MNIQVICLYPILWVLFLKRPCKKQVAKNWDTKIKINHNTKTQNIYSNKSYAFFIVKQNYNQVNTSKDWLTFRCILFRVWTCDRHGTFGDRYDSHVKYQQSYFFV